MIENDIYYTSPLLKNISHGFFSKKGGVSSGIYNSLNCGKSSFDKKSNIIKNRRIVSKILNFNLKNLVIGNQFHSNKVIVITEHEDNLKCDALISLSNNITLGVLTADCCPILVAHKQNLMVATIHLGWKGLITGILENFYNEINNLNIKGSDLLFSLGPKKKKNSYEVAFNFKKNFLEKDKDSSIFFSYKTKNKFLFDLRGYSTLTLKKLGFSNIWSSSQDTYAQKKDFFSYRQSTQNKINDYGRMLSVIKK